MPSCTHASYNDGTFQNVKMCRLECRHKTSALRQSSAATLIVPPQNKTAKAEILNTTQIKQTVSPTEILLVGNVHENVSLEKNKQNKACQRLTLASAAVPAPCALVQRGISLLPQLKPGGTPPPLSPGGPPLCQ